MLWSLAKVQRNKTFYFVMIILSVVFQAASGVCSKYASMQHGSSVLNWFFIAALLFLVLQAITWQQTLLNFSLSYAFPFMSITNFLVLGASALLFGEIITIYNVVGLALISGGIMLLSRGDEL
jgi:drug/metabolite transporter (DMT)-like permease